MGFSHILKDRAKEKNQKDLQDIVLRNAKKLKQLTDDILQVSQIETQSLEINKQDFDLTEVLKNIINDFEYSLNKDNHNQYIKFKLIFDEKHLFFINADKNKINQVISNLLDNAIKFTSKRQIGDNDECKISARLERKDKVIVAIEDNGQGINKEIFPRLFTKFATKSDKGTGLGLYISKNIIEAHGSNI